MGRKEKKLKRSREFYERVNKLWNFKVGVCGFDSLKQGFLIRIIVYIVFQVFYNNYIEYLNVCLEYFFLKEFLFKLNGSELEFKVIFIEEWENI